MTGVTQRIVTADEGDLRLDRWFRRHYPTLGHGVVERLLRTGQVRVDGRRAKAGQRLAPGQVVRVPPVATASSAEVERPPKPRAPADAAEAEALRRAVLYRDDAVIVVNKLPGLAVQGGTGTNRHIDGLLEALQSDGGERPRLVHRLDKDTSGALVLACNARAARDLTAAFRSKAAHKLYWAVVVGVPSPPVGRIDLSLGKSGGAQREKMRADPDGRTAITDYRTLDHVGRRAALVGLNPRTGRTHQLRVHMAALGTPILGDGKYGGADAFLSGVALARRLHLHARRIVLPHPAGGMVDVVAPLPTHLRETMALLGLESDATFDIAPEQG